MTGGENNKKLLWSVQVSFSYKPIAVASASASTAAPVPTSGVTHTLGVGCRLRKRGVLRPLLGGGRRFCPILTPAPARKLPLTRHTPRSRLTSSLRASPAAWAAAPSTGVALAPPGRGSHTTGRQPRRRPHGAQARAQRGCTCCCTCYMRMRMRMRMSPWLSQVARLTCQARAAARAGPRLDDHGQSHGDLRAGGAIVSMATVVSWATVSWDIVRLL